MYADFLDLLHMLYKADQPSKTKKSARFEQFLKIKYLSSLGLKEGLNNTRQQILAKSLLCTRPTTH